MFYYAQTTNIWCVHIYIYCICRQFSNIDKSKTSFARLTFLSLGARFVCIRFWLTWLMDDDDDNNDIDGKNVAQVPLWYTHPDQTPTPLQSPLPLEPATHPAIRSTQCNHWTHCGTSLCWLSNFAYIMICPTQLLNIHMCGLIFWYYFQKIPRSNLGY